MSNNEEPLHQSTMKTSRVRANFRPKRVTLQHNASGLKDWAAVWMETHPWRVLGVCLGAAGLLGYRLGVRS